MTTEQAKPFLIGHTMIGDRGAKDLMEAIFLDPNLRWDERPLPEKSGLELPQLGCWSPAPDCP
jgi:hypothetical protein